MKSELKSCPFCGAQPVRVPSTSLIHCNHCHFCMIEGDWNTRPESPLVGLNEDEISDLLFIMLCNTKINKEIAIELSKAMAYQICAKFGSPQKESGHFCHFIPCPVCEKDKPDPRFVEVGKIEWPKKWKTIKDGDVEEGAISHEEEMRRRYSNETIDACISAEKNGRMSEEEIMEIVYSFWPATTVGEADCQRKTAHAIYAALYGGSQATQRGGSNVKGLKEGTRSIS